MPVPNADWIMHEGTINDQGQVASSVLTHTRWYPFVWQKGSSVMLDGLQGAGSVGYAVMVNTQREAVGTSATADGVSHAVLWDAAGRIHDLGTLPGYTDSTALAINRRGQVVGYAFNKPLGLSSLLLRPARAFLWEGGRMRDLGTLPGCPSSRAYAINDAGQIAGWVLTADQRTHAMLWEDGVMLDLGTFADGRLSVATALNDAGQVVGSATHPRSRVSAFLWQDGVMSDLGRLPGDRYSKALGVNDRGQAVGISRPDDNVNGTGGRPFVWDAVDGMRDLMALVRLTNRQRTEFAHTCMALSINNQGQILGLRYAPHNQRFMFVLTPLTANAP